MRLPLLIVCLIAELVAVAMLVAGWHESLAVAFIAVGNTVALVLAVRPRRRIG